MKSLVCSIYNDDTKEYGAIMLFPTKKIAIAQFQMWLAKSKDENKYFCPEDYALVHFGEFDSSNGKIVVKKDSIIISEYEEDVKE